MKTYHYDHSTPYADTLKYPEPTNPDGMPTPGLGPIFNEDAEDGLDDRMAVARYLHIDPSMVRNGPRE